MKVEAGQLIGGKYELERLLGKGSMGEVWSARHATLEDSYAVKLVDVRRVPDAAGRFQLEAHIAAKLSKKTRHIVSVTDHGEDEQLAYLVMQLLEGQSLEQRIEEAAPLALAEVSTIVTQVARALTHAHAEGFVHRDLKPANVFLTKDEEGRTVVKLLDFGIARSLTPVRTRSPFATAKDTIVGTPSYMSPEQTIGHGSVDHRCDVWSLAVVAYEALAKELPFEGETLQDVLISIGIGRTIPMLVRRQDLPEAIYAFFDKAFADAIEERFSSATELASTFARATGVNPDLPSMAPPLSMMPEGEAAGPPANASPVKASRVPTAPAPPEREGVLDEEPVALPMHRGSGRVVVAAFVAALALIAFVVTMALRRSEGASGRESRGATADAAPDRTRSRVSSSSASGVAEVTPSVAPLDVSPSAVASTSPPSSRVRAQPSSPTSPSGAATSASSAAPAPTPEASASASAAPTPSVAPAATPGASHSIDRGEVF